MSGESKFYSKNYLDAAALLTSDNAPMTATLPRLYDRDWTLLTKSSGANSDAIPVEIEMEFRAGGLALSRTFDTIVILGHNLANFLVQVWNGATFVTVTGGTIVGETNDYTVVAFASQTQPKVKIVAQTTRTPDQEKEFAEILVMGTEFAFAVDRGLDRIGFRPEPTAIISGMADGGRRITDLRWTGNRVERYVAGLAFVRLTAAEYDSLRAIVRIPVLTVYVEPLERPREFYQVSAKEGGAPSSYATTYKGNGYNLQLSIREI